MFIKEIQKRRTFGIISHPDAGKTTLTEKLLLYGGDIQEAGAVKSNKVKKNIISIENIDEKLINEHLYTKNSKNVDLLIRTGGEFRLSNFLLWQNSYAELLFYDLLWPEFRKKDFYNSIITYQKRNRRFGKTT